jgi:hypothetical protein
MAGRALWRTASFLAVAAIVASCGGGGPSPSGGASPGDTTSAAPASSSAAPASPSAGPASSGTPPVIHEAAPIEQVVYFLQGDSTGTKPTTGTRILLMFEPAGRALLYLTNGTDRLAHHGTWRYESGQLSLKFAADDFKPDVTFALNLDETTVTMPFAVFDTVPGTSTWERGALSLVTKTNIVFRADATDPDSTLSPDEAIAETLAVAQAMVGRDDPIDVLPLAASDGPALAMAPRRDRILDAGGAHAATLPRIKSVTELSSGLHVEYDNESSANVALYGWSISLDTPDKLVPGPIASDPRVRLNPKPSSSDDDLVNKTAVLIAPFASRRTPNGAWTGRLREGVVKFLGGNPGQYGQVEHFNWQDDAAKLQKAGYKVETAIDSDVTILRLVQILGGRSLSAPGIVIFNTHGLSNGNLTTGVDLGNYHDTAKVDKNFAAAITEVEATAAGFAGFEGGSVDIPKTVERFDMAYDNNDFDGDTFMMLTPAFWRWLASRNVHFDKSLVYISSCSTDATPDLRTAISAKAYFAWTTPVSVALAGTIANYLVDSMSRPTRTAEEVYYNVARVVSTGQRIYDEDQDLDAVFSRPFTKGFGFTLDYFHGYGWNGKTLVPYAKSGWLDGKMNPGHVWWLVFAGRWSEKAGDGAAALAKCEKDYWQPDAGTSEQAGLRSPFCNAAAPGGPPTPDEVAYATFVLTGKAAPPYSGTPVPRVTLADAKA